MGGDSNTANSRFGSVFGEPAVSDLSKIDGHVDIVDVFRRPEYCTGVAQAAVDVQADVLWLQQGIRDDAAMNIAETGGLRAVQDRCLRVELVRLLLRG